MSDRAAIRMTIEAMVAERDAGKTVCPSEVARALAGRDEKKWRLLMAPIREEAVKLVAEKRLTIRRKGKIADPANFKGIYRLGAWQSVDEVTPQAEGKSASVRPVIQ